MVFYTHAPIFSRGHIPHFYISHGSQQRLGIFGQIIRRMMLPENVKQPFDVSEILGDSAAHVAKSSLIESYS